MKYERVVYVLEKLYEFEREGSRIDSSDNLNLFLEKYNVDLSELNALMSLGYLNSTANISYRFFDKGFSFLQNHWLISHERNLEELSKKIKNHIVELNKSTATFNNVSLKLAFFMFAFSLITLSVGFVGSLSKFLEYNFNIDGIFFKGLFFPMDFAFYILIIILLVVILWKYPSLFKFQNQ